MTDDLVLCAMRLRAHDASDDEPGHDDDVDLPEHEPTDDDPYEYPRLGVPTLTPVDDPVTAEDAVDDD